MYNMSNGIHKDISNLPYMTKTPATLFTFQASIPIPN